MKNCPCKGKERDLYGKKAQMESGAHECAVSGSGRFSAHEAHHGPEHRVLCAGRCGAGLRGAGGGPLAVPQAGKGGGIRWFCSNCFS